MMATVAPRRHSDGYFPVPSGKGKGRAGTSLTGLENNHNHHHNHEPVALAPVPEDDAFSPDADERELSPANEHRRTSTWGRRMSWIPGWTFAGSEPVERPEKKGSTAGLERRDSEFAKTNGRMSRLRSSITTLGETFMRDTEPSHETNFAANPEFPEFDGRPMMLDVYGSIDSLTPNGMRLQIPRGAAHASFTKHQQYHAILEYMRPKLQNGDMLVRPFVDRYTSDRTMAMVVRGAIQDCVFKCMIVGIFPLKMFGEDVKLESYELEVMMYDPGMSFALG